MTVPPLPPTFSDPFVEGFSPPYPAVPDNSLDVPDDFDLLDSSSLTSLIDSSRSPFHIPSSTVSSLSSIASLSPRPPPTQQTMAAPPFYMPLSHTRDAPKFREDERGFKAFFKNVSELAKRAGLTDADAIEWAISYGGDESENWENVACMAPGRVPPPTLDEFREEVRLRYPHLLSDRRYSIMDLHRHMEATQCFRTMSQDEVGAYYRKFTTISDYLIAQDRLSTRERNTFYLKGFPQFIRTLMKQRLAIKKPDVRPADGYSLEDLHEAAIFAVDSRDPDSEIKVEPEIKVEKNGQMEELLKMMGTLLAQNQRNSAPPVATQQYPRTDGYPTPGGVAQNPPQWEPQPRPQSYCMFCNAPDHFLRVCPIVGQYLQQGKIIRNSDNKITLPDGRFLPRTVPGSCMRERLDNYADWKRRNPQRNQYEPAATNFFESNDEYAFEVEVSSFRAQ